MQIEQGPSAAFITVPVKVEKHDALIQSRDHTAGRRGDRELGRIAPARRRFIRRRKVDRRPGAAVAPAPMEPAGVTPYVAAWKGQRQFWLAQDPRAQFRVLQQMDRQTVVDNFFAQAVGAYICSPTVSRFETALPHIAQRWSRRSSSDGNKSRLPSGGVKNRLATVFPVVITLIELIGQPAQLVVEPLASFCAPWFRSQQGVQLRIAAGCRIADEPSKVFEKCDENASIHAVFAGNSIDDLLPVICSLRVVPLAWRVGINTVISRSTPGWDCTKLSISER